jgi:predicted Rossmann fold nucleotide-binding protein DprA/Smf involved in DNA uptake
MNNSLTDDTKAIILLCGVFGKDRSEKPLSQTEYTSLVRWLISVEMRPCDLLQNVNIAAASIGANIDKQRLESLLGRGVQLGFAVEEWQRNGIWIISRSDPDYPARYKKHLKDKASPLLFGVGNRSLLAGGGLAIIGSRNVDKDGEAFTRHVAELCAYNGIPVVSGGARGVDQFAMTASLEAAGVTIGIVAENLLKKSLERSARHGIADGRLLLISPYHPNARFTVGTAMARNKLIYARADYGLVVSAEHKKGGTWAGAQEELRRDNHLPVFVRVGDNAPQGNDKLIDFGAIAWPEVIEQNKMKPQLADLANNNRKNQSPKNQSLFDFIENKKNTSTETEQKGSVKPLSDKNVFIEEFSKEIPNNIYQAVLPVILKKIQTPMSIDELAESLDVCKAQLNKWLKRAVENGFIRKLSRPVRYELLKEEKAQHRVSV